MRMGLVIATAIVFGMLVMSEVLWRRKVIRGELARKFVHILVGSFVAFWPYFMSWRSIQLMSVAFLAVVVVSQRIRIFHAVHEVSRKSWGEELFAVSIGLAAWLTPSPLVFAAAVLHLALADGFAALVGKRFGMLHQYRVGDYTKTLAGTCTFWIISTIITATVVLLGAPGNGVLWPLLPLVVWLPLAATVLENVGIRGTDNLLVPMLVIAVLSLVHVTG